MRVLFGTDGIRGRAREYPLDIPTVFALGEALAHRLRREGQGRVLMGMDTRESGMEIAQALASGMRAGGGEAILIGVIPTPGVAWLCRTSDAEAGLSISASHNPFEDNGVKIFGHDGMKLADSIEEEIEDELRAIRRDDAQITIASLPDRPDLVEKYERFLVSGVRENALRGKKVVLDTGHGAAYRIGPDAFRRVAAEVVVIHDRPNGRNINESSGALHPETLAKTVVSEKADFGVAFDGDADRAIFADDRGKIRDGDEILYLWAQRLKREGRLTGNRLVTTVMSNFGFERQLAADGIELIRAQVGDKYVLEQMLAHKAILGGEQSGHIIDLIVHTTGDGIHTALVFGELLAGAGRPFSALPTFEPMPQILLNQKIPAKPPLETLPRFQEELRTAEAELGRDGRILVRYSGTENLVRVMVEGVDEARINKIAKHLVQVLASEIA